MKRLFGLLTVLLLVVLFSHQSKGQAIYLNGGYSWTKGVVGVEYKSGYWGFGLGYMPTKMPMSGNSVTSVSAAITFYTVEQGDFDNGWYATLASTSAGYRMEDSFGESVVKPMTIVTVGYLFDIDNFYLTGGGGFGIYSGGTTPTYEITLGIRLWED
ncbi:MAG: hypothetical protein ACOC22_01160 [bacterium]